MNIPVRLILIVMAGFAVMNPVMAAEEASNPVMPQGLQQAYRAARHSIEPINAADPAQGYRTVNLDNHLRLSFHTNGIEVTPRVRPNADRSAQEPAWRWRMRLDDYGTEGNLRQPDAPVLSVEGDRISYQRGDLQEWYHNSLTGLEQGFTLQRPDWLGKGELVLSFALEGDLQARWQREGEALDFYTAQGAFAFSYDSLVAFDAQGQSLPAGMQLTETGLHLQVETAGAAWPVTIDPLIHIEDKLVPEADDSTASDRFGLSVDMDGNLAIIGSYGDDDIASNSGAAYIFERIGGTWIPLAKLKASDPEATDRFGVAVAIDGDTALVGAYLESPLAVSDAGSAYIFYRDEGGTDKWGEKKKLFASDKGEFDYFGSAVALDGDTALVGAYKDNTTAGNDAGSAYIFYRDKDGADNWGEQKKLVASDAAGSDVFGISVALHGDIALVGADSDDDAGSGSGSAYFFYRDWGGTDDWGQKKKVTSGDAAAGDRFGIAVAINGDTALIGAYHDGDAGANSGSAYIFYRNENGTDNWGQKKKLTASDAAGNDLFGYALAVDGDIALVGGNANGDNGPSSGSAYLYYRDEGGTDNWGGKKKLLAPDAAAGDQFGWAVALSGTTALVGADFGDSGVVNAGTAYVLEQDLGGLDNWGGQRKLAAVVDDRSANDIFGWSVAIDGDTALVGAAFADCTAGVDCGAAYVFTRAGTTWGQQAKLTAGVDADVFESFGYSVTLDGDTALVGANAVDCTAGNDCGAAYVFTRAGTTWGQQAKLTAGVDADVWDAFGSSVTLDGDTALVGAPNVDCTAGNDCGAAYVFTRAGTTWGQQARLTAGVDADVGDLFGDSVFLDGDTALVGANAVDCTAGTACGAAYVFTRTGTTWGQQAKLTTGVDADVGDLFGSSVTLDGDTALVGAPYVDCTAGINCGAAYVFTRAGTTWGQQARLTAGVDADIGDLFGSSVTLDGDTALVGAPNIDCAAGNDCGAAYVFQRLGLLWGQRKKLVSSDSATENFFGDSVFLDSDTALVGAVLVDCAAGNNCGAAYINRFECGFGGDILAGRWTMIGLPCEPPLADTVADILGDNLDISQYGYRWVVFRRDANTDSYVSMSLLDSLVHGEGYWVYSLDSAFWDVSGFLTEFTTSPDCGSLVGCYEIPLTAPDDALSDRYNMIGNPFSFPLNWSGVRVVVNGIAYKPHEASDMGYVDKNFWKYNGAGYDSFDDITLGMQGELDPHQSIWVRTLGGSSGKTVSLLIPAGQTFEPPLPPFAINNPVPAPGSFWNWNWSFSLISSAHAGNKPEKPGNKGGGEWYLRLIAEAPGEGLKDSNTVLGQLPDSYESWDKHDLPELAPLNSHFLTVVFPHADWPFEAGDFSSDFHALSGKEGDEWLFEVKSDDPWREIVLSWRGHYKIGHMWLEDVESGVRVNAVKDGALQAYTFNMNGQNSRLFRWVLGANGGKGKNRKLQSSDLTARRNQVKSSPPAQGQIGLPPGIERK